MAKHTSLRARFLGFAGGHFVLSALGATVAFAMFGAWEGGVGLLGPLTALLMLLSVYQTSGAKATVSWQDPGRASGAKTSGLLHIPLLRSEYSDNLIP